MEVFERIAVDLKEGAIYETVLPCCRRQDGEREHTSPVLIGQGVLCVPLSHADTSRVKKGTPMKEEDYSVVPVIPVDGIIHNDSGFCDDMTYACHENAESIKKLNQAIQDGIVTAEDANRIFRGQTV